MLPFELTKDTPYLALSGELWSVFYEYFNRNWPCYKGFLLYLIYGFGGPPFPSAVFAPFCKTDFSTTFRSLPSQSNILYFVLTITMTS